MLSQSPASSKWLFARFLLAACCALYLRRRLLRTSLYLTSSMAMSVAIDW
jgi:hypothetical protein